MNATPSVAHGASKDGARKALLAHNVPPGTDLARIPSYADERWDFGVLVQRPNAIASHATVNFAGKMYGSVADPLRELLFARLNYDVPRRKRLPPSGVASYASKAGTFIRFIMSRGGPGALKQIRAADLAALIESMRGKEQSEDRVRDILITVSDAQVYGEHLDAFGFDVDVRKFIRRTLGSDARGSENETPRIPPEVIHPLLEWSMRYIEQYSAEILTADRYWSEMLARSAALYAADQRVDLLEQRRLRRERLLGYLGKLEREGAAVPIWGDAWMRRNAGAASKWRLEHPVDCVFLDAVVGVPKELSFQEGVRTRQWAREAVEATIERVGVQIGGLEPRPMVEPSTGRPWRDGFDSKSLRHEQQMLQAACYVVCAYLTGMRDSEIQAMEVGCLKRGMSRDGLVERYYVSSKVFKNKKLSGEDETWIAIEPVAKAIGVMEQLSASARAARGGTTIWRSLDHGNRQREHISQHINKILNDYIRHLNDLFGNVVPEVGGKVWRLSTRQFRRTVAWHIANRPYGLVAGMIQFKHLSIAMFEGYAGHSESNFPQEIAAEKALSQIEDLLSHVEARRAGEVFRGGAAKRVHGLLDAVIGEFVGVVADEARLRSMLAHPAKSLHVGILADCFYEPSQALCVREDSKAPTPLTFLCQPTKCSNACITMKHRPFWEAERHRAREMLRGGKRLGDLQKQALRGQIKRIEQFLGPEAESSPG